MSPVANCSQKTQSSASKAERGQRKAKEGKGQNRKQNDGVRHRPCRGTPMGATCIWKGKGTKSCISLTYGFSFYFSISHTLQYPSFRYIFIF